MVNLQGISSAAQQLPLSDKLTLLTELVDWIRREFPIFSKNNTAEIQEQFHYNFWKPNTIEELMAHQGITGPQTIQPLKGFDDDVDELVATIREWRDEDAKRDPL